MTQSPDRREVLEFLAALSPGTASSALALAQETATLEVADFGDVEISALRDLAKAYLDSAEEDAAGVEAMAERMERSGLSDTSLLELLRLEMREDLAAGRLANIYGWMLSRTRRECWLLLRVSWPSHRRAWFEALLRQSALREGGGQAKRDCGFLKLAPGSSLRGAVAGIAALVGLPPSLL